MAEDKTVREIKVYGDPVKVQHWTEDSSPEEVRELSNDELSNLMLDAREIANWLKRYPHEKVKPGIVSPLILDWVWIRWLGDSSSDRPSSSDAVRVLGAAFGTILVRSLGMRWIEVTDQFGRDLCVRGGPLQKTISPFSSIQKRVSSPDSGGFFGALFELAGGKT